jgi:hypothetical protein
MQTHIQAWSYWLDTTLVCKIMLQHVHCTHTSQTESADQDMHAKVVQQSL